MFNMSVIQILCMLLNMKNTAKRRCFFMFFLVKVCPCVGEFQNFRCIFVSGCITVVFLLELKLYVHLVCRSSLLGDVWDTGRDEENEDEGMEGLGDENGHGGESEKELESLVHGKTSSITKPRQSISLSAVQLKERRGKVIRRRERRRKRLSKSLI